MQKIKELIVVEGKHDRQKLEKLFDCDVICTDGLSMSPEVLETIKTVGEKRGVIILTDPDHPGEVIRKKIAEIVPQRQHVFVNKKEAIGKRNVGIEYVSDEDLVKALENRITFDSRTESLSWAEFLELGIMGNSEKRNQLCTKLHIAFSNNKTLYKRLNMMGMTYGELKELI
ncbi:MAG: ribonuclease M5 [Erysipelotrichaceae bacterium]|nr:ribonuclease M5 [Erysipelotrichaceae bacterium]